MENEMPGGETASFAPTLTFSIYGAFETIWGLLIFVKVEGSGAVPAPASFYVLSYGLLVLKSTALGVSPPFFSFFFLSTPYIH